MKNEVRKFRQALDQIDWSTMPCQYREFPTGTCGDISDILAEHLYSLGYEGIEYVCGMLDETSHAWLEIGENAIDITADQFDSVTESVLFQLPGIWHSRIEEQERRKAGYNQFQASEIFDLMMVHNKVNDIMKFEPL